MIELSYTLKKEEIEESLLCLEWKREGWIKKLNIALLSTASAVLLAKFYLQPDRILYMLISLVCMAFLFSELYLNGYKRKHKVNKLFLQGNNYEFSVSDTEIISSENKKYEYVKDNTQVFLSEHIISIKFNDTIFCIPKRIVSNEKLLTLITILNKKCKVITLKTKRRSDSYEKGKPFAE